MADPKTPKKEKEYELIQLYFKKASQVEVDLYNDLIALSKQEIGLSLSGMVLRMLSEVLKNKKVNLEIKDKNIIVDNKKDEEIKNNNLNDISKMIDNVNSKFGEL